MMPFGSTLLGRAWSGPRRGGFFRSAALLVGGTASAQAIALFAAPILTRLYSPEAFGIMGAFTAVLSVLAITVTLRYSLAIPLPELQRDAAHVAILSLLATLVVTALVAAGIHQYGIQTLTALRLEALVPFQWLWPIGVALLGAIEVGSKWAIRARTFGVLAATRVAQTVTGVGTQLAMASLGPIGLLAGSITNQAMGAILLIANALRSPGGNALLRPNATEVVRMGARYKRLPIFSTWSGAFNTLGSQIPTVFFAAQFGVGAAGLYFLAYRVLSLPMNLIGNALGQVFMPNAVRAHREGGLGTLVARLHSAISGAVLPPMLLFVIAAPDTFSIAFGEEWRGAGNLARWMAPWLYFVVVSSPMSTLFTILEKEPQGTVFQASMLAVRLLAIAIGSQYGDLTATVAMFSLGSSLGYCSLLLWEYRAAGNTGLSLLKTTSRDAARAALVCSPFLTARVLSDDTSVSLLGLAASLVLTTAYYVRLPASWRA